MKHLRSFLLFLFSIFVLILVSSPAYALRKLSLSPASFEFSAAPGAEISNLFLLENEGDEDLAYVFVYSTNVKVAKNARERYELPKPEEPVLNSPASWVFIKVPDPTKILGNFPFLDIKKGQKREVAFSIKIPDNAPPGDYTTVVFFETREPQQAGKIGTNIAGRVGCRIRIRVQGEIIENNFFDRLNVRHLVVGNIIPFELKIVNKGNIDAAGEVKIRIKNSDNVIYEKTLAKKAYLYARNNLSYSGALEIPKLGFGTRKFEAVFEYKDWKGNKKELRKEATFFAVPLTLFYLFLLLIAAIILFVSFAIEARMKKKGKAFKDIE